MPVKFSAFRFLIMPPMRMVVLSGTTSSVFIFFLSMVGGTLELVVLDCSMAEETSCSISSRTSLPAVMKGVTVMMTPVSRYS